MPANFVLLSDMHLGYDLSILNDPVAQDHLISAIADLCDGSTDRLILNGDCFEACVPRDAGQHDAAGLPPSMATAARSFFTKFTAKISTTSLVLGWGNHDLSLWELLAASCGAPLFTNDQRGDVLLQHDGQTLLGAGSPLSDLIGPCRSDFLQIRSAYPNYILGHEWPYTVFHHGHFLDDLILGREEEVEYLALRALMGAGRPNVDVSAGSEETVRSIYDKVTDFTLDLWAANSPIRATEWRLTRRGQAPLTCPSFPEVGAHALVSASELQDPEIGIHALWYANVLLADPTTPPPIGNTDWPSYLFIGHDHKGGSADLIGMDGRRFRLINTGGWTAEGGSTKLHGHVVVWRKGEDAPNTYCVRV